MPPYNEQNVYTGRARLRAKDIREALSKRNIDPAIIHTFEGLADNDKTQRDQINELAKFVDQSIDTLGKLIMIITKISEKFPDIDALNMPTQDKPSDAIKNVAQANIKLQEPEET